MAFLFMGTVVKAQEMPQQGFNYQGVARDADGELLVNTSMSVTIALRFGGMGAPIAYSEVHDLTTDPQGVFSMAIGQGATLQGGFDNLPWGSTSAYLETSLNGESMGITPIRGVPFAMAAGNVHWQRNGNELIHSPVEKVHVNGSIQINDGAIVEDISTDGTFALNSDAILPTQKAVKTYVDAHAGVGGGTDDQNLVLTGDQLSIENGLGTVDLAAYINDADADPTNEFQTLSFDAATNELSLSDGNTVTIPSGGTDADADPTNEIDVTNETGILLGDGSVVTGLVGTADGQVPKWNATMSLWEPGTDESGIGGGVSLWSQTGSDVYYSSGKVGIGIEPSSIFHVHGPASASTQYTTFNSGSDLFDGVKVGITNDLDGSPIAFFENLGDGPLFLGTNDITRMMISRTGNVGVGVFQAEEKLHVDGTIRSNSLSGAGERNVVADADGNLVIGAGGVGSSLWSENGENVYYDSGNVGIGTTAPNNTLHISSDNVSPVRIESTTTDNFTSFYTSSGYKGYLGIFSGDDDMEIGTGFGNSTGKTHLTTFALPRLTVAANGDIGIGTTSPTEKLEVHGNIKTIGEVHSANTGAANMIPIAYGIVADDGTILSGTGNFTASRVDIGNFTIRILGETENDDFIITANSYTTGGVMCTIGRYPNGQGRFAVNLWNFSGSRVDSRFSFVAYRN
ncbi:hypothetical protein DZC72_09320 [Maribacter algicola]|uniref:Uncharacterized protein n=2 Tax=Maribacter algicola TaxID=2498892 RepID=A0A3R8Q6D3_9FLAO|nr:hypothetical protein DZC72_09320 [Maribacter algicola]